MAYRYAAKSLQPSQAYIPYIHSIYISTNIVIVQWCARPASTPPLEKYYFASVRDLAKSPPTVYSNCSEAIYLAIRTFTSGGLKAVFLHSVIIFVKYPKVSTYTIYNMAL